LIVNAVVSVANVTDVINGASVISVNLSYLFRGHNNSRGGRFLMPFVGMGIAGNKGFDVVPFGLRLGDGWAGMATLIRE